jgi:hypothetical protein
VAVEILVEPRDDRDRGGGQILVVHRPTALQVDHLDAGAVPTGDRPGEFHVDAAGRGILVALVHLARVVERVHLGRNGRTALDVGLLHARPGCQRRRERVGLDARRTADGEVGEHVRQPGAAVTLAGELHHPHELLGREVPVERHQLDPGEALDESRPRADPARLELALGALLVGERDMIVELDDHPRPIDRRLVGGPNR